MFVVFVVFLVFLAFFPFLPLPPFGTDFVTFEGLGSALGLRLVRLRCVSSRPGRRGEFGLGFLRVQRRRSGFSAAAAAALRLRAMLKVYVSTSLREQDLG